MRTSSQLLILIKSKTYGEVVFYSDIHLVIIYKQFGNLFCLCQIYHLVVVFINLSLILLLKNWEWKISNWILIS